MDNEIAQALEEFYRDSKNGHYYNSVKPYMDADGWFPDDILGNSFWALSLCEKKLIGDKLYWRFVE